MRETSISEEPRPTVYRVIDQADQVGTQTSTMVVRTTVDPASIAPAIRQAIWSVDPNQPVWRFDTLDELADRQFSTARQSTALMSAFALLALLLASLGLYGVLAYAVAQRTGEIGVRMALGATSGTIARSFVARGSALTIAGLAGGFVLTAIAVPLITPLLYGLRPTYLPLIAGTGGLLLAVSAVACFLPHAAPRAWIR